MKFAGIKVANASVVYTEKITAATANDERAAVEGMVLCQNWRTTGCALNPVPKLCRTFLCDAAQKVLLKLGVYHDWEKLR